MNYIYWYIATILKYRNTVINCVSHDSFLQTALLNSLNKTWIYCSISAIQYISSRVQSFSDWKMNKLYQHNADRCQVQCSRTQTQRKKYVWMTPKKELTARTSATFDSRTWNLFLHPPCPGGQCPLCTFDFESGGKKGGWQVTFAF